MAEKCQRCGKIGKDRRTLYMACFYEMNELNIKFKQIAIRGRYCKKTGIIKSKITKITKYALNKKHEECLFPFYTLRVCKQCRSEWLMKIKEWFHNRG